MYETTRLQFLIHHVLYRWVWFCAFLPTECRCVWRVGVAVRRWNRKDSRQRNGQGFSDGHSRIDIRLLVATEVICLCREQFIARLFEVVRFIAEHGPICLIAGKQQ
jgi:hypothetical protein